MSIYRRSLFHGVMRIFSLPRLSLPLILTLGLTLGAVLCVLAVTSVLQLKPLPGIKQENQLYSVELRMKLSEQLEIPFFNERRFAKLQSEFSEMGSWGTLATSRSDVEISGEELPVSVYRVSRNTLETLGTRLVKGANPATDEVDKKVWISHSLWQQAFMGRDSAMDRTLNYLGEEYQVAGIIEDFSSVESGDVILPQQIWRVYDEQIHLKNAESGGFSDGFGRIIFRSINGQLITQEDLMAWFDRYVDTEFTEAETQEFVRRHETVSFITPYREDITKDSETLLVLLFAAVIGLLVMASLNLLNLYIAHYQSRSKEFAIQLSLGATPHRLRTMLMLENLPSFATAATLGLLIASWAIHGLPDIAGEALPLLDKVTLDLFTVACALVITLLLSFVFSLFGLINLKTKEITNTLNSSGKGTQGQTRHWVGRSLMILQLTLASLLLTASVMLAKQSYQLVYEDLGYDITNAYEISISYEDEAWAESLGSYENYYGSEFQTLRANLQQTLMEALPGSVALDAHQSPLTYAIRIQIYLNDEERRIMYIDQSLSHNYFSTFQIPFVAGSNLTQEEIQAGDKLLVIDERMAREITGSDNPQDAVGMDLKLGRTDESIYKIKGVVANIAPRVGSTNPLIFPMIYSPRVDVTENLDISLILADGTSLDEKQLEEILSDKDPRLGNISLTYLQDRWERQTAAQRISLWVIITLTGLTLFLAGVGIAGLTQMTTNQKRYEMAVRMATGAKQSRLLGLIFKEASWMLALGLVLGFIISALSYTQIKQSVSIMPEFDWLSMIILDLVLVSIVLAAVAIPAWRIIKADPMQALREL